MIKDKTNLLIITGMSGAGKTVAVRSFEDLGYYCVDNMPPTLLPKFLELMKNSKSDIQKIALVMDLRGRDFFDSLFEALDQLDDHDWIEEQIIFFDAMDEVLVSRYKETRRSHPLAGNELPLAGIQKEREILNELKGRSQNVIDTSRLKPKELREKIVHLYADQDQEVFSVHFVSFGFKYGSVIDADLVFDVRFLPNPHYVTQLQPLTGLNADVATYVFKWADTKKFNEKLVELLRFMLPRYKKEGKSQLVIAIGCTGGQHRSVALTEYYSKTLSEDYITHITHRDIDKRKGH